MDDARVLRRFDRLFGVLFDLSFQPPRRQQAFSQLPAEGVRYGYYGFC